MTAQWGVHEESKRGCNALAWGHARRRDWVWGNLWRDLRAACHKTTLQRRSSQNTLSHVITKWLNDWPRRRWDLHPPPRSAPSLFTPSPCRCCVRCHITIGQWNSISCLDDYHAAPRYAFPTLLSLYSLCSSLLPACFPVFYPPSSLPSSPSTFLPFVRLIKFDFFGNIIKLHTKWLATLDGCKFPLNYIPATFA